MKLVKQVVTEVTDLRVENAWLKDENKRLADDNEHLVNKLASLRAVLRWEQEHR